MKITNNGNVYNDSKEEVQVEEKKSSPLAITNSGVLYEKPSENDVKNTEAFKIARAKYDDKAYDNLSDQEKDNLALKDVERATQQEQ